MRCPSLQLFSPRVGGGGSFIEHTESVRLKRRVRVAFLDITREYPVYLPDLAELSYSWQSS